MLTQPDTGPIPKSALILAFDANMFQQGLQAIETIKTYCELEHDICVLPLGLAPEQRTALDTLGINLHTDRHSLRSFRNAPPYAYAQTCRPFIPQIFPGYELYMWIDADIRFCDGEAFHFYLRHASANRDSIVISREIDSTYGFFRRPEFAQQYFENLHTRLSRFFGQQIADHLRYFTPFNSGIFAMHKNSPIWASYARNMDIIMQRDYDHLAEQDALNVTILQHQMNAVSAPSIMNWVCSHAIPAFGSKLQRFVRPEFPFEPISALHLSSSPMTVPGLSISFYELYRQHKMTK